MQIWPETPVIGQGLQNWRATPAPDVLKGGKNISKKKRPW